MQKVYIKDVANIMRSPSLEGPRLQQFYWVCAVICWWWSWRWLTCLSWWSPHSRRLKSNAEQQIEAFLEAPKMSRRFFTFLHQNYFFSHQLGFFPAPKQFFSAPNDFGNCIWFCTKLILFLHQNDTKSLEAGTKLFWFCTKYFLDFFWFSTKYIPILHQFVTN